MYLQCKHGFVEADRWDGAPIQNAAMQSLILKLAGKSREIPVIVVRARARGVLTGLLLDANILNRKVFKSPEGWDYEYRAFMTLGEFQDMLAAVALGLDYRNFKSWTGTNDRKQEDLAHAVWHAAHDNASRQ